MEWPSADRGSLELKMRRGPVFVRYEGCEMEVLSACEANVDADYTYEPYSVKTDEVLIRNDDELHARLPLGAAKLSGELEHTRELRLLTGLVGAYELQGATDGVWESLPAACAGATHIIRTFHVGAYELGRAVELSVGAEASVPGGPEAGGSVERIYEVLSKDGDLTACVAASPLSNTVPAGCGAMVRLEVTMAPNPTLAESAPRRKMTIAGGVLTGLGVGSVFAGALGYGMAAGANAKLEDLVDSEDSEEPEDSADFDDREAAVRRGLRGDALGVVGMASAAAFVSAGIALLVVGRKRARAGTEARVRPVGLGAEVRF